VTTCERGRRSFTGTPAASVRSIGALLVAYAVTACGEGHAAAVDSARADSIALVRQDSLNRAQPGYVVDSILPMAEQLRRFRASLTESPRALGGNVHRKDQLVHLFVRALESADTAALVRLTITRAEFAYLVFPESPLSAPPYAQPPDLAWMQHSHGSATGLQRLLQRLGGSSIGFRSLSCAELPAIEGANRIWRDCTVRFSPPGGTTQTLRLFGSLLERDGRFKILSYSNGF
jgi:hypothetical protein